MPGDAAESRGDRKGRVTGPFLYGGMLALLVLVSLAVLAWFRQQQPVVLAIDGYTMGSTWSARFVGGRDTDVAAVRGVLEQELAALDLALSGYRDDSALAALNRAPVGQWIDIPEHLSRTMRFGLVLWRESGGAFDMTVKPLVSLWGFGAAEPRATLPSEAEIALALGRTGSERLEISPDGRRARRLGDVAVDVDGVAPGYAAGVLSTWLSAHGYPDHLVEVGGEMRASGRRPDGSAWRIGIEAPEMARGHIERIIRVRDVAITTAGDYRDFFEVDGKRYQHILDPVTGWPVTHNLASVTVLAPGRLSADGYATAIMVLGEEKGMAFANARGLPVFMIVRDGNGTLVERYNDLFSPYLMVE